MARWEPGTRERLQGAALELFASNGFEQTTAAQIAQSVGLTERTFFRHFDDKRDVLFGGNDEFLRSFRDGVRDAPAYASALDLVASGLRASGALFTDDRRPFSRMRKLIIDANPALCERELQKRSVMATTLHEALLDRGVDEPAATLAAESGATIFAIAFTQWVGDTEERSFDELISEGMDSLRGLTAPR